MRRTAAAIGILVLFACAGSAEAAFPGDNGSIAFTRFQSGSAERLFTMNPDGSQQTRLPFDDRSFGQEPAWSADGTKVAFAANSAAGGVDIFAVNADGTGLVQLTNHPQLDTEPTWSPDGQRIAFVSNRESDREIWVMNANGSGQTRITDEPRNVREPAWSPDGQRIAYTGFVAGATTSDLFTVDPAGGTRAQLTSSPADEQEADWSPDGAMLAFASKPGTGGPETFDIHLANADGTGEVPLLRPGSDTDPAWSPDGKRIAFVRSPEGGPPDVFSMSSGGGSLERLTFDPATDRSPSWQPLPVDPAPKECATPEATGVSLAGVADLADVVSYDVRTAFGGPDDDPVERFRRNLPANLPIPLDVNGDVLRLPDVTVEFRIMSTSRAELRINRLLTALGQMPLAVEAHIQPPNGPDQDVDVVFGYDAREGREPGSRGNAPRAFTTTVDFDFKRKLTNPDGSPARGSRSVISPHLSVSGAGSRLDLLAGTRTAGDVPDELSARAALAPVPSSLDLEVVDECRETVRTIDTAVDTNAPTVVTADAISREEGVRRDAHAELDRLTDTATVTLERDLARNRDEVDYSASHAVDRVELRVDEYRPGSEDELARQALAQVNAIPRSGFAVVREGRGRQGNDDRFELEVNDDPLTSATESLGRVEGGFATGRAVELVDDLSEHAKAGESIDVAQVAYADLDESGAAVQVHGLRSAALDLADNPGNRAGDTRLEVRASSKPLFVRHQSGERVTLAQVSATPSEIGLRLEAQPLVVEYSGSETIDRIHATVTDPNGIVTRTAGTTALEPPTFAELTATGVPTCLRVTALDDGNVNDGDLGDGGMSATTAAGVDESTARCGAGVGQIEALLATTSSEGEPDRLSEDNRLEIKKADGAIQPVDGLALEDASDRFVLQGRASGLKSMTVSTPQPKVTTPKGGGERSTSEVGLEVVGDAARPQPLVFHSDSGDTRYLDATLAGRPQSVKLTLREFLQKPSGDKGFEIVYDAAEAIDPAGESPALLLDTNAGLSVAGTKFVDGRPNTRVELPRVPRDMRFCNSTLDFCGLPPNNRPPEVQLRFDASESIPLLLFSCSRPGDQAPGDPGRCEADNETATPGGQVSTAADIEGIRFLELDLAIPAAANDNEPGFIHVNTNPFAPDDFGAPGGQIGHPLLGDKARNVDHDAEARANDIYMLIPTRVSSSCPGKVSPFEVRLGEFDADQRLIDFIITGDGAACIVTGVNVLQRRGSARCGAGPDGLRATSFDSTGIPFIGGLTAEICGTSPDPG